MPEAPDWVPTRQEARGEASRVSGVVLNAAGGVPSHLPVVRVGAETCSQSRLPSWSREGRREQSAPDTCSEQVSTGSCPSVVR